jgi:hypothetical protein
MPHEMNQKDWRDDINVRDQYGRLWLVALEKHPDGGGSHMPTGQITPAGWQDPLHTPQEYISVPKGEFGQYDRNKLIVDLKRWVTYQQRKVQEWRSEAIRKGRRLYKNAFTPSMIEDDEVLREEVGPAPWPAVAAIQRAARGDRELLGLRPLGPEGRKLLGLEQLEDLGYAEAPAYAETNPKLPSTREAPMPYFTFKKLMKEQGITEPAALKAKWQAYRAALAS